MVKNWKNKSNIDNKTSIILKKIKLKLSINNIEKVESWKIEV